MERNDLAGRGRPASSYRIAYVRNGTRVLRADPAVRALSTSPIWLAVADRRLALVSPSSWNTTHASWITADKNGVQAAKGVFELLWCGAHQNGPPVLKSTERRSAVLIYLARGLTDTAIAGQLHVTERTVRREIRALMTATGSATRFQLGLRTALGVLSPPVLDRPENTRPQETRADPGLKVRS
ncbi:helix-turn-helix domain-containing protein [Murinocardiopsis flavida]|nr:helix-turn-helix transcriptional regulator [Murinocardiopsis flavida]